MRKMKLGGGMAVLSIAMALCLGHGAAAAAADAESGGSQSTVDPSKGIEYLYKNSTDTAPLGIMLNGNSVIIKESENSTDTNKLYNIYNDANRNGVIDAGEDVYILDGSSDIHYYAVYGVYGNKLDGSMSITLDGAQVPAVYGVYDGSAFSSNGDCSVTINVKGDTASECIYVSYGSDIAGDLCLNVESAEKIKMAGAATNSTVSGKITVDVKGKSVIENVNAAQSSYCKGSVTIDTAETASINNLNGLYQSTIDGDLTEHVNCISESNVSAVTYGNYTGKDYCVKGNVIFDMENAECKSVYPLSKGAIIGGDVTIDIKNSKINTMYGISEGGRVSGNTTININNITSVDSSSLNIYGLSSSSVSGKYTFDVKKISSESACVYGSSYTDIHGDVDIDVDGSGSTFSPLYGICYGTVYGRVDVDIKNCQSAYSSVCGLSSVTFSQTEPDGDTEYANVVTMKNVNSTSSDINAISGVKNMKSVWLKMDNVKAKYALSGITETAGTEGRIKAVLSGCSAKNINIIKTQYGYVIKGNVDVTMNACTASENVCLLGNGNVEGNLALNADDVVCRSFTACEYGQCSGTADIVINGINDESFKDESGNSVVDSNADAGSGDFNLFYKSIVQGDLTADISKIHFGACGLAGGNGSCEFLGPKIDITLVDSSFKKSGSSNYFYLMNEYNSTDMEDKTFTADINIKNTDFSELENSIFCVSVSKGRTVNISIDDACKMPENYYMYPSYGGTRGFVTITCDGSVYYGGSQIVLDKDVTAKEIYFGSRNINGGCGGADAVINDGVTVTATDGIYIVSGSSVLNSGTIKGDFKTFEKYTGSLYMKRGTVQSDTVYQNANVYYPLNVICDEKAVTLSVVGPTTTSLDEATNYVKTGETVKLTPVVNRGYILDKVTFKGKGDANENDAAAENGVYTFSMPEESCTATVAASGKQITVSKTTADPSALIGTTYTSEKPLYDLSTLVISHDARDGKVSYSVDKDYSLPEGLKLDAGKIVGTPDTLYESGKKTVIHVTGKNGTETMLTLNIVVSKVDSVQDNTDSRITVDEENKEICLNGTSVVVKSGDDNSTCIYVDDDMDGNPDTSVPVYSGDLSEYTIIGMNDVVCDRRIRITVAGGNIKNIYGARNSEISYKGDDAVTIDITGGKVEKVYVLDKTNVNGTIAYAVAKDTAASVRLVTDSTTSTYSGYIYRTAADVVTIGKEYELNKKLEAASLIIYDNADVAINAPVELTDYISVYDKANVEFNDTVTADRFGISKSAKASLNGYSRIAKFNITYYECEVTIGENATLDTDAVNVSQYWAKVYQKGTLKCPSDKFTNKGTWVVAGSFAEGMDVSEWTGLYYRFVSCATNMTGASASLPSQNNTLTYENKTYVKNKQSIEIKYTDVAGYSAYVSANGGEPVVGNGGKAYVTAPDEQMTVSVEYIANQISISKEYSDPVVVADAEYDAENPAYDLSTLKIVGDTVSPYGTDMQYRIKSGSKLPDGLVLDGSRITGTPSAPGESKTAFVVTGRNGTAAEVNVVFKVLNAGTDVPDINKLAITVDTKNKKIDLGGNSVVIIADSNNSKNSSIFLDSDHDGIADNARALKISGAVSYNLSGYEIYGYTDSENAYDGDISVILRSGTVGSIYGAGAIGSSAKAVTVNGSVTVHIMDGYVEDKIVAAGTGDITTVNFIAEGGKTGRTVYGTYAANAENVNFTFTGAAQMYTSSRETQSIYVTYKGNVTDDVDIKIGATKNYSPFVYDSDYTNSYSYFYGVSSTTVKGDVNCEITGQWFTGKQNNVVSESDVDGDVNVDIKSGYYTSTDKNNQQWKALVYNYSNHRIGNLIVKAGSEGKVTGEFALVSGGIVDKVVYVDENAESDANVIPISSNFYVQSMGSLYLQTADKITVGGEYTIDADIQTKQIEVLKDSNVKIAEGVTVTNTSTGKNVVTSTITGNLENDGTWNVNGPLKMDGTFVNKGTMNLISAAQFSKSFENYGEIIADSSETMTIDASAKMINHEDAQLTFGNLTNSGMIVNYGGMKQLAYSSSLGSGKILTTKLPEFKFNLNNYRTVYYKLDVDYPAYCFKDEDPQIKVGSAATEGVISSGVEGDSAYYVKCGTSFYIEVGGEPIDDVTIDSIVFGSSDTKMTTSNNKLWSGVMVYEPATATVNMAKAEATQITLAKTEDEAAAQVGVSTTLGSPLYDLRAIEIQNDQAVENGYVAYSIAKGQELPAGLTFSDGRIYGTPSKASDEVQTVKFTVRGQNQTTAEFTLNITKIEKGVPSLAKADTIEALAGKTLADVALPKAANGTYSWADNTKEVGKAGSTAEFDAYFVPNDTENYDWSKLDEKSGTYELLEDGTVRIAVKLSVYVRKQDPVYEIPEGVTVTYGETIGKAVVPETENGTFVWENADESVGDVGKKIFYATYVPADEDVYERAEHIAIEVEVKQAKAVFTQAIDELDAKDADTLADIDLPERKDGTYTWYTDRTTKITDGETYKLCFRPSDTTNYDWTKVSGWNKAYHGVVFDVKVAVVKEHVHDYGDTYESDAADHWRKCSCGDITDKAAHIWDKGTVNVQATDIAAGSMTYKCTVCGYTKQEPIKALGKDITNKAYGIAVSGVANQAYTGKAVELKNLKITEGKKVLQKNVDYTVSYSNNVRRGIATVTISGIGKYRGTIQKNFRIMFARNTVFSVTQPRTKVVYRYKITKADETGKGTVTLIGTTKSRTDRRYIAVSIDSAVNINGVAFTVTGIGTNAFKGYKYIKTVSGGAKLVAIGGAAFKDCTALTRMPIGGNVRTIGNYAFCGCKKLGNVSLGNNVTSIGAYAFYDCEKFTTVTLGAKVTTVGKGAYKLCKSLTTVTIGANVRAIGESAFESCTKLKTVVIKSTKLTKVYKNAFKRVAVSVTFKLPRKKYSSYVRLIKAKSVAAPSKAVYKYY